jgi:hypothetical protein
MMHETLHDIYLLPNRSGTRTVKSDTVHLFCTNVCMEQLPSNLNLRGVASDICAVAIFVARSLQNTSFKYFQELIS